MDTLYALFLSSLLIVFAYGLARGLSTILCRREQTALPTKHGVNQLVFVVALLTVCALLLIHLSYPLWDPLLEEAPSQAVAHALVLVGSIISGLVFLLGVYAVFRGFRPLFGTVYEYQHTSSSTLRRWAWKVTAVFLIGASVLLGFSVSGLVPVAPHWLAGSLVIVGAIFTQWVSFHVLAVTPDQTRDPTADERSRIDRCFERFDCSPENIVIFEGSTFPTRVITSGHGSVRTIWIERSFLESVSDDDLAVALAQTTWKNEHYFWERYHAILATAFLLFVVSFYLFVRSPLLVVIGMVPAFLVLVFWSRNLRTIAHRADVFASSRLGGETVCAAYERIGDDIQYFKRETSNPQYIPEPDIDSRIEHVKERFSILPDDCQQWSEADTSSTTDVSNGHDEQANTPIDTEPKSAPNTDQTTPRARPSTVWCWGIIGFMVIWILSIAVFWIGDANFLELPYAGQITLALWVGIPICIGVDGELIQGTYDWPSYPFLIGALAIVPVLNLLLASWYLWKRRTVIQATAQREETQKW